MATIHPTSGETAKPRELKLDFDVDHYRDDGARKHQEDMFTEEIDLWKIVKEENGEVDESIQLSFFGVYDGHAGKDCAIMVSKRICKVLIRTEAFKAREWEKAMVQAYETMEEEWFADARKRAEDGKVNKAGCCAVSALIVDGVIYVANAGDSRCVMIQKDGIKPGFIDLSDDQKPTRPSEKERIEKAGSEVFQKTHTRKKFLCIPEKTFTLGPPRINPGGIAVARSIGTAKAKLADMGANPGAVVATPEMSKYTITDQDLCLVIGSDGIWDNYKTSLDCVKTVQNAISVTLSKKKSRNTPAHEAAEQLVDHAISKAKNPNSQDNTTAVCVCFWEPGQKKVGLE